VHDSNIPDNPDSHSDKHSTLSISRLYGQSNSTKAKHLESLPISSKDVRDGQDPRSKYFAKEKEQGSAMVTPLKAGQSILDQIGESDFSGWMNKRGDRYNSWKQRYVVLKGPHLYWFRSSSKTVRIDPY
jgi:hypothetical protein